MEFPILSQDLATRIEKFEKEAHLSRMEGIQNLPKNPLGVEIQHFGAAVAFIVRGSPFIDLARVLGITPAETPAIVEIVDWFHQRNLTCQVDVSPHHSSEEMLLQLVRQGLVQKGFLTLLYGVPQPHQLPPALGINVHEYSGGEVEEFAHLAVDIDGVPAQDQDMWAQVIRAELPDWRTYIAFVGGKPAAHAALRISHGVAVLMYAGTKPEYRGYGCQSALIRKRIADAAVAGCDLVTGAAYPGTSSQRNLERAGMRVGYTKALWVDRNKRPQ